MGPVVSDANLLRKIGLPGLGGKQAGEFRTPMNKFAGSTLYVLFSSIPMLPAPPPLPPSFYAALPKHVRISRASKDPTWRVERQMHRPVCPLNAPIPEPRNVHELNMSHYCVFLTPPALSGPIEACTNQLTKATTL